MLQVKKITICLIVLCLYGGCSTYELLFDNRIVKQPSESKQKLSQSSNLELLVTSGNNLMSAGKLDDAFREFFSAKEIDPNYVPALIGLSSVYGYRKNYVKAIEILNQAIPNATDKDQQYRIHLLLLRFYIDDYETIKDGQWLFDVKTAFLNAISTHPDQPEPYYYIGLAYKMVSDFNSAKTMFTKVVNLENTFSSEANREIFEIKQMETETISETANLALKSFVTRKELVSILLSELEIDKALQKPYNYTIPKDISDCINRSDIEKVVSLNINGLNVFPDNTFEPEMPISRGEFALMTEDILARCEEKQIKYEFRGKVSIFPDLKNDNAFFNAAMVSISRHILDPSPMGEFRAGDLITGPETLLGIRTIKNILKN